MSLLIAAAAAQEPPVASATKAAPNSIARTASQQCRAHASVSVCDDALRWNPSDPSLLTAMGDALVHVRRPADAIRAYQRAAALAPGTPGIEEKIQAAQAAAKASAKKPLRDAAGANPASKHFSNSDPDTQTH